MIDEKKRKPGKYIEVFTKGKYTKTEATVVGRDYKVMVFERTYEPGIKYPMTWDDIK